MTSPVQDDYTAGYATYVVEGKHFRTYYRVYGSLGVEGGKTPLVALHGGPGANSSYLSVLSDLTRFHGTPVIVYDQVGNGLSTHVPEKNGDVDFWTPCLFVHELKNLLVHLGINEDYYLFGHSWGGLLGALFALEGPPGLKRLILASTPVDMKTFAKEAAKLRAQLPQDVQDVLDQHERDGTYDNPEYEEACLVFYARHFCRLESLPALLVEGLEWTKKDPTVYSTMNGPSEFSIVGSLKDFSIADQIHKIQVPTLVTNGLYDEVTSEVVQEYNNKLPNAKWVQFQNSSHVAMFEERELYIRTVAEFLLGSFM